MAKSFICSYCKKDVPTLKGLRSHIAQRQGCRDVLRRLAKQQLPKEKSVRTGEDDQPNDDIHMEADDQPMFEPNSANEGQGPPENTTPNRRTQMEEVEDEEAGGFRRYVEDYGEDVGDAGKAFKEGQSHFSQWREAQQKAGHEPWAPFDDLEEWDLAQWLLLNAGQNATDKFLKLPIVSNSSHICAEGEELTCRVQIRNRAKPSFKNKRAFYKRIDTLPRGPKWDCEEFKITGDERDDKGHLKTEIVQLWKRDPVECVKELMGNPAFRDKLRYSPQRAYEDDEGKTRMFDEMWTGDWWWDLQVSFAL